VRARVDEAQEVSWGGGSALVELTRAPVVLAHLERLAYAAVIATTSLA
jgi:hypothetical protein